MGNMYCKECVTAKKKFKKGDRVVLSVDGCRQMPELIKSKSTAVVVGFGRSYNCVRVLITGQRNPSTFHSGYWERI
jgi:hypothetical protein